MPTQYISWPFKNLPIFSTFSALPNPYLDGGMAITLNTYTVYIFDGQTLTWLAIGGTSVPLGMGALDGQAPSATGATITTNLLFMQSASNTTPGLVNNASQTFSGQKTFSTGITGTLTGHSSLDVATSSLGTLSEATSSVLTLSGWTNATVGSPTIQVKLAGAAQAGYLSSADWNTFNNKQSTLTTGNFTDAGTDGIVVTGGTGAVIGSGTSISQHVADASHNGYLSSADWSTFNSKQSALTLGNLTDAGTDGITVTGGTGAVVGSGASLSQHVADASHNGYLAQADWSTFNNKQAGPLTGDVTTSGAAATIANNAVSNAKLAQMGAHTYKGNNTGSTTNAADITSTQLTADLKAFTSSLQGMAPASGGGSTNFLRADGTWAAPSASFSYSEILYTGVAGNGAVDTPVVKYNTLDHNTGTAFTDSSTANNGTRVTINEAGEYSITASSIATAGAVYLGITLNSTAGPTGGVTPIAIQFVSVTNPIVSCSGTIRLAVNDVIRVTYSGSGAAGSDATNYSFLRIVKVNS